MRNRMFDLWQYVPYLLNRTGQRVAVAFSAELDRFGLSLPMWRVMAALWHAGEQRLNELAQLTTIEQSTLSRLIGAMQQKELVSRVRSGADARAVALTLTPAGRDLTERLIPLALRIEQVALAGLSEAEVAQLKGLLVRVFENSAALAAEKPS